MGYFPRKSDSCDGKVLNNLGVSVLNRRFLFTFALIKQDE